MSIDYWAIDDAGLDPYQFRILSHIARVGICWKSVHTLASDTGISVGKVSQVRNWLEANGHIEKAIDPKTGKIGHRVTARYRSQDEQTQQSDVAIVHDMNEMFTTRTECSPHEQECSPHEQECSPHEQECSPHEPKYITLSNNIKDTYSVTAYAQPYPEPVAEIITALSKVSKTSYWAKTENDFESAAYTLFGFSATPDDIYDFSQWWQENGHYEGKPALKSIMNEWANFTSGVTYAPKTAVNGKSAEYNEWASQYSQYIPAD